MSGITYLLRMMVKGDKEGIVSVINATDTPTKFISQLTSGQKRKRLYAYNAAASGSGEIGYGYDASITKEDCMFLPKGERVLIPVSEDVDVYFVSTLSGETNMSVRIEEIA